MNQSAVLSIANRNEIIARYRHYRTVSRKLNDKLVRRLSKEALHEGAKRLGILRRGTLVFNSEDETSVLMDYCIYDVRRNGRNAIEEYLTDSPPDTESDEMACLRAMQQAIYSLFVVESVESGLGVTVRDLRSDENMLVVDMGFSSTAEPGLVFASRLLSLDGFSITGGAALPIAVVPAGQQDVLAKALLRTEARANGHFDPASLIRACLSDGCSSHITYEDPIDRAVGPRQLSSGSRSAKVGRNDACPCGSGRKFKQCCMKRL